MLVLSRRINEKVVFPGFGAAVRVLGLKGNAVRLGVEAPADVTVLRGELPDRHAEWGPPATPADSARLLRAVDARLRVAGIGLNLLADQVGAGRAEEALVTAGRLAEDLELLRQRIGRPQERPAAGTDRQGRKALLVEDDANERELLAWFLRLSGFEVDTAGDGADALDRLRDRGRPDVVLLDMGLPRCDGPSTVRAIRGDRRLAGLKVIAVSGAREEDYGLGRGPDGLDDWFQKPLDPAALVRRLEQDLGQPARA